MRNYILFWIARGIDGFGTIKSFTAAGDRDGSDDLRTQIEAWLALDPGNQIQFISPAYLKMNKANVVDVLKVLTTHYPEVWNSSWAFLQDGLKPHDSPRETWSHGE